MLEEKKTLTPAEAVQSLALGEFSKVYDTMKAIPRNELGEYDKLAADKGFTDFDEMVSFYTVGDSSDDAPGCKVRDGAREMFEICMEDFSAASEETQAVQKAGNHVLFLAALRSTLLPLVFLVAFIALWLWRGNPIALVGLIVACCWAIFQIFVSYKQAKFLQRAYNLFRKYGVHHIDAKGEVAEGTEEESEGVSEASDEESGEAETSGDAAVEDKDGEAADVEEDVAPGEDKIEATAEFVNDREASEGDAVEETSDSESVEEDVEAAVDETGEDSSSDAGEDVSDQQQTPLGSSSQAARSQKRRVLRHGMPKSRPAKLPGKKFHKAAPRRFR